MPKIKSAQKALRQNKTRRARNLKRTAETKAAVKAYKKLIIAGKKDEAQKHLALVYKKLDKLAKTKVIKKNKASRLKSRLAKKLPA